MSRAKKALHPICETLRDARAEAGLTQQAVAGRALLRQGSISYYENGVVVPSLESVDRWAATLGYALILVSAVDS